MRHLCAGEAARGTPTPRTVSPSPFTTLTASVSVRPLSAVRGRFGGGPALAACLFRCLLALAVVLGCLSSAWAQQDDPSQIQGQRPLPVMQGWFKARPGAWASYLVRDRKKDEYYHLYFSTLERDSARERPAIWMEVVVKPTGQEPVVTRFLAEETADGPGKLLEVIVQPTGYEPFSVPESFFEDQTKGVGQVQAMSPQGQAQRVKLSYLGRALEVVRVQAKDAKGGAIGAMVSEQVPPLCLVGAVTPEVEMYLDDWGDGAQSLIQGEPVNFYLWLALQMGKAMGGDGAGGAR